MDGYSAEIEFQMIRFFQSLGECDRRRYAAIEVAKFGHGGISYIGQLLGCDAKTIEHGKAEIQGDQPLDSQRQRKKTADAKRRKLLRRKLSKTSVRF